MFGSLRLVLSWPRHINLCRVTIRAIFPGRVLARISFFFVINNFYFLFFHTQHNRISKIKQNKTADTYSTSQGSIKREGEREGQQEHKSHSFK